MLRKLFKNKETHKTKKHVFCGYMHARVRVQHKCGKRREERVAHEISEETEEEIDFTRFKRR